MIYIAITNIHVAIKVDIGKHFHNQRNVRPVRRNLALKVAQTYMQKMGRG